MREVAIAGVGMTKFGVSEITQVEMFSEAAMDAVNASNMKIEDVQAVFVGNADGNLEEGQAIMAPMCAAELGINGVPATTFQGACSSGTLAIINAFVQVSLGLYDVVIAGGTERQRTMRAALDWTPRW